MLHHDEMQRRICSELAERYGCAYTKEMCCVSKRHIAKRYRSEESVPRLHIRQSSVPDHSSDKDELFVTKLDDLHYYILQFRSLFESLAFDSI